MLKTIYRYKRKENERLKKLLGLSSEEIVPPPELIISEATVPYPCSTPIFLSVLTQASPEFHY